MRRMWINQPSNLLPHHALHGTRVLAESETEKVYRVWFLDGPIHSQQIPRAALSEGWPAHTDTGKCNIGGYIVEPVGKDLQDSFPDHWYAQPCAPGEQPYEIAPDPVAALTALVQRAGAAEPPTPPTIHKWYCTKCSRDWPDGQMECQCGGHAQTNRPPKAS